MGGQVGQFPYLITKGYPYRYEQLRLGSKLWSLYCSLASITTVKMALPRSYCDKNNAENWSHQLSVTGGKELRVSMALKMGFTMRIYIENFRQHTIYTCNTKDTLVVLWFWKKKSSLNCVSAVIFPRYMRTINSRVWQELDLVYN